MAQLELLKVAKTFGKNNIIHGLDLTVEAGEFLVVVGPSGCGKSTLLVLLPGLNRYLKAMSASMVVP